MLTRMAEVAERCARRSMEELQSGRASAALMLCPPVPRISGAPRLQPQQPSPHHEQVGQRRAHLDAVQILRQSPIAYLLKAKDPLDHPDRRSEERRVGKECRSWR